MNENIINQEQDGETLYTVSAYIDYINSELQEYKAKVIGEVGQAQIGPTGHVYFTLKDEKDGSILSCIIWKSKYIMYGIRLEEGMKIIVSGCPSIYPPSGRFSFIADVIELAGEGALKKEYERLKAQLEKEGLFEPSRKRPLPKYPQKVGVITSKQGAVLADFLNNLGRFGFQIKMIDSRVEGQEAVADLLAAIRTFKKEDIEVLVIMRGGGSLEALMAFNNELLVREIANFKVPVVAAIGHDRDVPLAAMVADYAPSTPTAAANCLCESWKQALLFLERHERDIFSRYEKIFENYREIEHRFNLCLYNFKNSLSDIREGLKDSFSKSLSGFRAIFANANQRLVYSEKVISINNPERQLRLGYSISTISGRVVRKLADAKIGEKMEVKVADGVVNSEVRGLVLNSGTLVSLKTKKIGKSKSLNQETLEL